ncbi:MAG: 5-deoxy-glucuronate isomerase [Acidimicrobiales bacterium]
MEGKWHRRAGSLRAGPWSLELTPQEAGWSWSSLRVLELAAGASCTLKTGDEEVLVLPLSGSCSVSCGGQDYSLSGRDSVLSGSVTDFAYVPCGRSVVVASRGGGRFAFPGARATRELAFRYQPAEAVPIEMRGAGPCSRRVTNFCTPESFEADRLIACEVITPAGNWSSYPPHKHDEARPGETELEEIYYFEVADGPSGPGMAYQRVYGSPGRPIDVLAEVRTGDVVLIPHGWHGPSMAVPGYDLYYLNVMAGPGERAWLICDDPAHAWARATWAQTEVDPRLAALAAPGQRR